jgi:hypothetical protein
MIRAARRALNENINSRFCFSPYSVPRAARIAHHSARIA